MPKLNNEDLIAQTLAEPSRRAILESLRYGPKAVSDIILATGLKQPNASNHLAKMRDRGIVTADRRGRQVYYSIALPVADLLLRLDEFVADPLEFVVTQGLFDSGAARSDEFALPERNPDEGTPFVEDPAISDWQNAYFRSLEVGREDQAIALVNAMLSRRLDLETIYSRIFEWALVRIGERYLEGMIDVAWEHVATAITDRMMARVSQFYAPIIRQDRHAILGCVAGNLHAIGLRMLSDGLRSLGWETIYLGADAPTDSFTAIAASRPPHLVAISCSLEDQFAEARRLVLGLDALRQSAQSAAMAISLGGAYVNGNPSVVDGLPVDFTSTDLSSFLSKVRDYFGPHAPSGRGGRPRKAG